MNSLLKPIALILLVSLVNIAQAAPTLSETTSFIKKRLQTYGGYEKDKTIAKITRYITSTDEYLGELSVTIIKPNIIKISIFEEDIFGDVDREYRKESDGKYSISREIYTLDFSKLNPKTKLSHYVDRDPDYKYKKSMSYYELLIDCTDNNKCIKHTLKRVSKRISGRNVNRNIKKAKNYVIKKMKTEKWRNYTRRKIELKISNRIQAEKIQRAFEHAVKLSGGRGDLF